MHWPRWCWYPCGSNRLLVCVCGFFYTGRAIRTGLLLMELRLIYDISGYIHHLGVLRVGVR